MLDKAQSAGEHETYWDGRDEDGRLVESGTYLIRVRGDSATQLGKVVIIK